MFNALNESSDVNGEVIGNDGDVECAGAQTILGLSSVSFTSKFAVLIPEDANGIPWERADLQYELEAERLKVN